jgi:hypothetical protein
MVCICGSSVNTRRGIWGMLEGGWEGEGEGGGEGWSREWIVESIVVDMREVSWSGDGSGVWDMYGRAVSMQTGMNEYC